LTTGFLGIYFMELFPSNRIENVVVPRCIAAGAGNGAIDEIILHHGCVNGSTDVGWYMLGDRSRAMEEGHPGARNPGRK
jgi:hypothetical protein